MDINSQPTEKQSRSRQLDVIDVWPTIQGEGPYAGMPATFVRLAGCNLRCPFCDTDYTSNRQEMTPSGLVRRIEAFGLSFVVLTGGEPFRQNLDHLCALLLQRGMEVQIETNGTLSQEWRDCNPRHVTIVCSPKTPTLNQSIVEHVDAYKYVLESTRVDSDGLPSTVLGGYRPARPASDKPIYLQPLDQEDDKLNKANLQAVITSCMVHDYRLCLQLHKIIGLP